MKKLFMLMLLAKSLHATVYDATNIIGDVKFTIKNVSVLNSPSLSPQKKLALIKGYTSVGYLPYNWQHDVYFGVDLATDEGKTMYAQFEKAYWFQQDLTVRCILGPNNKAPDSVRVAEPGNPQVVVYPFWTPFSVWAE